MLHGAISGLWRVRLYAATASLNFQHFTTPYCLVGHTHSPVIFSQALNGGLADERKPSPGERIQLEGARRIVNPGSVGQPRDGNPDAAYALLDFEAEVWDYKRVPYDVAATQFRMAGWSLPERLIARLPLGW